LEEALAPPFGSQSLRNIKKHPVKVLLQDAFILEVIFKRYMCPKKHPRRDLSS
jgi:hypothetical protein